mmetsp:Transcript_46403/g.145571  ORF Transcript_46403/g.145571 Transcript_46403/m.145571 type:complete len:82 (+) Transcript_46403:531-776(+)
MVLETPSQVKDVRSWLQLYGEPDPKRVPTGVMSTFRPSRVRFGKDKSRSSDMIRKVDGLTWHQEYSKTMTAAYGSRFKLSS